ncbi:ATP-binding protein [Nocardiopsis sp. NPDC006139]|uniref:ATP-binding protein n=1 Tax=Nocardiopsis sp. NPDC006139 TaxID=3154578 RepID=UPI0033A5FF4C
MITLSATQAPLRQGRRTLPGEDLGSVSKARSWVTGTLLRWEVEPPEELPMLVSELVTNAIKHTRSGLPDGRVTLRLDIYGDRIRLVVKDAGPRPGRRVRRGDPSPEDTHGRGLLLVEALSLAWGPINTGSGVFVEISR